MYPCGINASKVSQFHVETGPVGGRERERKKTAGISETTEIYRSVTCDQPDSVSRNPRFTLVIINHADDEQTHRSTTCLPGPVRLLSY